MLKYGLLLLVSAHLILGQDLKCGQFHPLDTALPTETNGKQFFKIDVSVEDWSVGTPVKVILKGKTVDSLEKKFKSFILQAHDVFDRPLGTWEVLSSVIHKTYACSAINDSLVNKDHMPETNEIVGLWHPPKNSQNIPNNGEVDFNAAVIGQHKVFQGIKSQIIKKVVESVHEGESDEESTNTDPEETSVPSIDNNSEEIVPGTGEKPTEEEDLDEKQKEKSEQLDKDGGSQTFDVDESYRQETELMLKEQERLQKEKEEEELESEGPWAAKEEQEKEAQEKEFEDEMQMYEKDMAEEEEKRQQMIQLEIKDKEEHDRLMALSSTTTTKEPVKDDDFDETEELIDEMEIGGQAVVSISMLCLLLPVALLFF